jgi:hypothetical protein
VIINTMFMKLRLASIITRVKVRSYSPLSYQREPAPQLAWETYPFVSRADNMINSYLILLLNSFINRLNLSFCSKFNRWIKYIRFCQFYILHANSKLNYLYWLPAFVGKYRAAFSDPIRFWNRLCGRSTFHMSCGFNYLADMSFSSSYRSIFSVGSDFNILKRQNITHCFDC